MEVDRHGLEILSRDSCMQLLGQSRLGRVGISSGALPVILPVNFVLAGEDIVFRTASGSKLDAALANAVVAFEVDEMESFGHAGWSVVVTGVARELQGQEATVIEPPIPHWAPDGGSRIVGISTDLVSGRRIVPGLKPPSWSV